MNQLSVDALHTDQYQITMAYAYFQCGKHQEPSTFESFYRKTPFNGEYLIGAGIYDAIEYIKKFKFTQDNIEYLKQILPCDTDLKFYEYLLSLNGNQVQIQSIKEGELIFPYFPIIVLKGPLALVQMLETAVTNLISFPSLIATNASRFRKLVSPDIKLLEFGLRRAQGPNGGHMATKYSYLGGFDGSSNLKACQAYNIKPHGTTAHSYINSFKQLDDIKNVTILNKQNEQIDLKQQTIKYYNLLEIQTHQGELTAFINFAYTFKENFLCLIDTYNTLSSGIYNYLCVASVLIDCGYKPIGIRLDSGDLAEQSIQCRLLFEKIGQKFDKDFSQLVIVASDDINEQKLKYLNQKNHQINAFGIGTNLVTCQKQPALGLVYKLIQRNGQSVVKLSEGKKVFPGEKAIYRIYDEQDQVQFDLMCLKDENLDEYKQINIRNMYDMNKKYVVNKYKSKPLLQLCLDNKEIPTLQDSKLYCSQQLQQFDQSVLQIDNPIQYKLMVSEDYYQFYQDIVDKNNIPIKLF